MDAAKKQPPKPLTNDLLAKYDLVLGSGSKNPFEPVVQIQAAAASVINLALSVQRKRRERQTIAEVGVWQGVMSRWLANCLPFATLHLIDPWTAGKPGDSWYDKGDKFAKRPQEQHDCHFELVRRLCEQFNAGLEKPRLHQHRLPSVEAAKQFSDGTFDVVFIDGAHDYDNVVADIRAWASKVRPGGYLAGHDYKPDGNYFGLVRAVNETTAELGLTKECWYCKGAKRISGFRGNDAVDVPCPSCKGSGSDIEVYAGKVWAVKIKPPAQQ